MTKADGSPLPATARLQEWQTHWRVALAALIGSGLSYSVWLNLSSLFVQPLQDAFGWSRGQIALAHNATLVGAFAAPAIGRLIDRIGARAVLLGGLVLTPLCFLALSQMRGSWWTYCLLVGATAVAGIATSGLTYSRIVCATFVQSRGLALATTRAGIALSAAVLPLVLQAVMAAAGWRAGLALFALLMLGVSLPLMWCWIPRTGRMALPPSRGAAATTAPPWCPWRSPKVLLLCLAAGLAYLPLMSAFTQLKPLLVDQGLDATGAGRTLGLIGVSALAGAALTGLLLDRFWAPAVAALFTLLPAVGFAILLRGSLDPYSAALAVALLGLGYGAETDLLGFMAARYFGMERYGTIYGLAVLFISVGGAIGISGAGLAYDHHGHYAPALQAGIGLCAAAAACYLAMGRYPNATATPPQAGQAGPHEEPA